MHAIVCQVNPRPTAGPSARVVDAVARLREAPVPIDGALDPDQADAVAAIYDAYADMLRAVARRIIGPDEAADVVHDVFCRLPRTISQYRDSGLGGWLRQCVIHAALMRLRTMRRRAAAGAGTFVVGDVAVGSRAARHQELCDELAWALDRIAEPLRRVVLLRVFDDATHQEIAARLGITTAASEVRLCRALKQLRALLVPSSTLAAAPPSSRAKGRGRSAHPSWRQSATPRAVHAAARRVAAHASA